MTKGSKIQNGQLQSSCRINRIDVVLFCVLILFFISCSSEESRVLKLEKEVESLEKTNKSLQDKCDSLQTALDKYEGMINEIRSYIN